MDLWNEWAPQILVLLSFALQLILLLLAGIRRREASPLLRIVLWLAYQLADSTAIYAIGHLSLCNPSPEHQLVPFWAPFLLLHLGGPDNITAYSLEDTKLWLRHLVSVIVQVSGATYVLYKQFSGNKISLWLAAFLMFVIGVVKYGERTCALRCGNTDTIRSSLKKEPRNKCHSYIEDKPHQRSSKREANEEEFLIRYAHALFHICKYAVVDDFLDDSAGDIQTRDSRIVEHLAKLGEEKLYAVMEIELSLMYDILYTKASVIHTWIGYCIRVVSPLITTGSLVIFKFSGKYGQNIVDIAITYVLLTGALLLEDMGISRYCITSRRWSGSMGQYNMLHFCTRHGTSYCPLLRWVMKMLGLEDLWETYHYSWNVDIPEKVKKLVCKHLKRIFDKGEVNTLGITRKNWGQETMKSWPKWDLVDNGYQLGAEFQEGIIIWHIATELLLIRSKLAIDQNTEPTVEAIKALSNYMMFLLVDRPDLLPGLAQKRLYQRTCTHLEKEWRKIVDDPTYHRSTRNVCTVLKELLYLHDNPNSNSRRPQREMLASKLLDVEQDPSRKASRVRFAIDVAIKLFAEEEEKSGSSLQMLLEMWIDFLVYAANRCSRESHAKKLNSGGEFTTVLWLLTEHLYQVPVDRWKTTLVRFGCIDN
uniref:DUF4220 domain-containing protein n=1 Tax=Oryza glumipatula TaxID=40148 RepID=A0A0D9ZJJ9_9ORYZ